jgi:hypothetical protein
MAQNKIYDVKVVGRRTDDQGRTIVEETFRYKGSFYMSDQYERADESSKSTPAEGAATAPPNPAGEEPVRAASTVEDPTLVIETSPAVSGTAEAAVGSHPAVAQEAANSPGISHAHIHPIEQTGEPVDAGAKRGHEKPASPTGASTEPSATCVVGKPPGVRPASPKGGQRRPPRTGTQRKHSP